jgi:hypothetical protein
MLALLDLRALAYPGRRSAPSRKALFSHQPLARTLEFVTNPPSAQAFSVTSASTGRVKALFGFASALPWPDAIDIAPQECGG